MSSRSDSNDEPGLFDDLPLQAQKRSPSKRPTPEPPKPKPASRVAREAEAMALFESVEPEAAGPRPGSPVSSAGSAAPPQVQVPEPDTPSPPSESGTLPVWRPTVAIGKRIGAGIIDLTVNLVVLIGVVLGLRFLGVTLDQSAVIPLLLFVLAFSFPYCVFPLAFWGRTPGMARTDIVTKSRDGRTLSFSQAARRWLGALLTLATLGIPLLFTVKTGDLPTDRFSGSQTFPAK